MEYRGNPNVSFILLILSSVTALPAVASNSTCIKSFFSFGDGITDTGNHILERIDRSGDPPIVNRPYGETFFGKPSGRASDGRLIVDFLADSLGLPFLPPYLAGDKDYSKGANFAVLGAAALSRSHFMDWEPLLTNSSLEVQLDWFKHLLSTLCSNDKDCRDYLKTALVLVGEIGRTDYYLYLHEYNVNVSATAANKIPQVVAVIANTVKDLAELGTGHIMVPGLFPMGCFPAYLVEAELSNATSEAFDPANGCLKELNDFSQEHNKQLQDALQRLRENYPNVNIIYADYYNAFMRLINSPTKYGLISDILWACCGSKEEKYHYDPPSGTCGLDYYLCHNPQQHLYWDGQHLTDSAHQLVASALVSGECTTPAISLHSSSCN